MVLTTSNSGKYLTKRWQVNRAKAIEDRTQFSADELDWLELNPDDGWGEFNKKNFMAKTQPVDQFNEPKDYDIRHRPGMEQENDVEEVGGAKQPGKGNDLRR